MSRSKVIRLVLLASGVVLAIGGCTGSGWLPWVVGAGLVSTLLRQQTGA